MLSLILLVDAVAAGFVSKWSFLCCDRCLIVGCEFFDRCLLHVVTGDSWLVVAADLPKNLSYTETSFKTLMLVPSFQLNFGQSKRTSLGICWVPGIETERPRLSASCREFDAAPCSRSTRLSAPGGHGVAQKTDPAHEKSVKTLGSVGLVLCSSQQV